MRSGPPGTSLKIKMPVLGEETKQFKYKLRKSSDTLQLNWMINTQLYQMFVLYPEGVLQVINCIKTLQTFYY